MCVCYGVLLLCEMCDCVYGVNVMCIVLYCYCVCLCVVGCDVNYVEMWGGVLCILEMCGCVLKCLRNV